MSMRSEPSLDDLLAEPIVKQLMSADGVSEEEVRQIAAAASDRCRHAATGSSGCPGIPFRAVEHQATGSGWARLELAYENVREFAQSMRDSFNRLEEA